MVILGLMFFIFGFTSWINSMLVPFFKVGCELNHFQSYLIVFTMYSAYLIMALPAGNILKKSGYKKGIMAGFFIVACGALLFVPARNRYVFLIFWNWRPNAPSSRPENDGVKLTCFRPLSRY